MRQPAGVLSCALVLWRASRSGGTEADGLDLGEDDFAEITQSILEVAEVACAGRVVSVLEGGYAPAVLRKCVGAHVRALMGVAGPPKTPP